MGEKARRDHVSREDLRGPLYQFNRAMAEEVLGDLRGEEVRCQVCQEAARRVLRLARMLSRAECRRYGLTRESGLVVVLVCESCLWRPDAKALVEQTIADSFLNKNVHSFDLGSLGLPGTFGDVIEF